MNFRQLTINDIDTLRPYFDGLSSNTCDFTVGGMFMWRDYFRMEFALWEGVFLSRLYDEDGKMFYNLPLGPDMETALAELCRRELEKSASISFCTIPEEYLPMFLALGRRISAFPETQFYDYLYLAEDMRELRGKKYSGQRNQISQFQRSVEDWAFQPLTADNLRRVREFFTAAHPLSPDPTNYESAENAAVLEVLDNPDKYRMLGGVLTANGTVTGFSLGEKIGDTLYTHIEKADRNIRGAYQMLTHQFALRYADGDVRFINREEDMGDEGLRTAKLAYHPAQLLKKYTVEVF